MAFCKNCGQEITDNAVNCPNCGTATQNQTNVTTTNTNDDKGGFLWGALGCCIPIVGLILFLVWKSDKPQTAKSVGIGAIVGAVLTLLFWVIYIVAIVAVGFSYGAMY